LCTESPVVAPGPSYRKTHVAERKSNLYVFARQQVLSHLLQAVKYRLKTAAHFMYEAHWPFVKNYHLQVALICVLYDRQNLIELAHQGNGDKIQRGVDVRMFRINENCHVQVTCSATDFSSASQTTKKVTFFFVGEKIIFNLRNNKILLKNRTSIQKRQKLKRICSQRCTKRACC